MLQKLKSTFTAAELWQGNFGLEREMLRVSPNGELATTNHPTVFGSKLKHPFITTDFAENQVELITPTCESLENAHHFLSALYDITVAEIGDELLWPQSMPANIQSLDAIRLAMFDEKEGEADTAYREYLLKTYGASRQVISGIHYNFSFTDEFLQRLYDASQSTSSFATFKDELYLKMVRNYMRYHWLLIYLLGQSPTVHESYDCDDDCQPHLSTMQPISIRNSLCGYENKTVLTPRYDSVKNYCDDLEAYVKNHMITQPKEYYSSVRLKCKQADDILHSLRQDGILYLEMRSLDLNPNDKTGVTLNDLKFLHLFMLYTLINDETQPFNVTEALENKAIVATQGLQKNMMLSDHEKKRSLLEWGSDILNDMIFMNHELGLESFDILNEKLQHLTSQTPPAVTLKKEIEEAGYLHYHLTLANQYKTASLNASYQLMGYEDLELSTQILLRECLKRGISFELLDRQDNFVKLQKGNHVEYVKQATKTSLDQYSTVLAMENKVVTKKILEEHQIVVPKGAVFEDLEACKKAAPRFISKPIVIKPKSTNFGLGITIFNQPTTIEAFEKAAEIAFAHDETVLVESFISGREYRILVIDDEVVGVLHRVPANVVGDGVSTIHELVEQKNRHPYRGSGYKAPLEKIKIDDSARLFLAAQNLTPEHVVAKDEVIYLRENSNISTGGDSLDFTDELHASYKQMAIKASKAIGARICGVDMMIENLFEPGIYGIIELNFNPAIHIHTFPYQGTSRQPAAHILKALGYLTTI